MNLYDLIVKKIKDIQGTDDESPITNISTSSMLTAEITLISSILVALIMLRLVSKILMIVAVLVVLFCVPGGYAPHATLQERTKRFTGSYDVLCHTCPGNSNRPILLGEFKCLKE
jgi:hypothetical protein